MRAKRKTTVCLKRYCRRQLYLENSGKAWVGRRQLGKQCWIWKHSKKHRQPAWEGRRQHCWRGKTTYSIAWERERTTAWKGRRQQWLRGKTTAWDARWELAMGIQHQGFERKDIKWKRQLVKTDDSLRWKATAWNKRWEHQGVERI